MTETERLLEQTLPPRQYRRGPRPKKNSMFSNWAKSQVAAYRVGLMLTYIGTIYFGTSAFVAGIPAFTITAPEGWTPVWASAVVAGGLISAVGSIRAGTEPVTREVRVFNRVELLGSILLFLTLGSYAAVLLTLGYLFGDTNRIAVGAGFVALGVHPAVRMVWLLFRPRGKV